MPRSQVHLNRLGQILAAGILLAPAAFAQFDSGQISGFVRDETEAMIPAAAVTATNEGNGEQRKTNTNPDGYYIFPQLFVGKYTISVEAPTPPSPSARSASRSRCRPRRRR
jgi:hypothetical protein